VIRSGMALPITVNLPFSRISSASLKVFADGTGNIPLKPIAGDRIAAMAVWPHIRPLSLLNPVPMLRSVPDAAVVANLLGSALQGLPVTPHASAIGIAGARTNVGGSDQLAPVSAAHA
jgi:hypothetical protein